MARARNFEKSFTMFFDEDLLNSIKDAVDGNPEESMSSFIRSAVREKLNRTGLTQKDGE